MRISESLAVLGDGWSEISIAAQSPSVVGVLSENACLQ